MFKRYFSIAATAAIVPAAIVASALTASATTVSCQNGFGDQCSTFGSTDLEASPHAVYWDVKGATAAPNVPVIGYGLDSASDKATDFVKVQHLGTVPGMPGSTSNTRSYSFVYTPNGHWSNLCVADPGTNKLVLRTCNGLQWQRFIAERTSHGNTPTAIAGFQGDRIRDNDNSNPFSLRDVATNLYVQDTSHASAFGPAAVPDTRQLVTGGVSTYTDNQLWTWQS